MESVTPEREPITHRLDFGDDWYRIRLNEKAASDVKAFLDVMFGGIPAEEAEKVRTLLAVQFAGQIAAARAKRGIELLVPAPKPGGVALPGAAVLIAEVVIPTPVVPDPVEVAARVVRGADGARMGVIAGSVAVRIDHSVADVEETEDAGVNDELAPPARQRIEYVIAVPNDPRWLSIDLSVQAVDGFGTEQIIAEFDQGVRRLSWSASD
ncbi:MAG: hypothetical protein HOW97_28795 [Catenulispora sp.]|nr:hypothetical protein [Catenulispora sp.]